jgi:hypothetical protein
LQSIHPRAIPKDALEETSLLLIAEVNSTGAKKPMIFAETDTTPAWYKVSRKKELGAMK